MEARQRLAILIFHVPWLTNNEILLPVENLRLFWSQLNRLKHTKLELTRLQLRHVIWSQPSLYHRWHGSIIGFHEVLDKSETRQGLDFESFEQKTSRYQSSRRQPAIPKQLAYEFQVV